LTRDRFRFFVRDASGGVHGPTSSGNVQLNWNAGTLQSATNLSGPFNSLTNAVSPYTIPAANTQQFYRAINN
jgi:hypothetical protein